MIASAPLQLLPCEEDVCARADALILQFALSGERDDLLSLARACEGFDDALSRAAGQAIGRRALNLPTEALPELDLLVQKSTGSTASE